MTEDKTKIEVLEEKVEILTEKLNEVISCLEDNELTRKLGVDYLYPEGEEENAEESEEETPSE